MGSPKTDGAPQGDFSKTEEALDAQSPPSGLEETPAENQEAEGVALSEEQQEDSSPTLSPVLLQSGHVDQPGGSTSAALVPAALQEQRQASATSEDNWRTESRDGMEQPRIQSSSSRGPYPQFLERFKHPSAQDVVAEVRNFVGRFPSNLSRPQAVRRIHSFLAEVVPRLISVEAFSSDSAQDAEDLATEGLEKFVILKLYKLLFRYAPADVREDERADSSIAAAAAALEGSFLPPARGKAPATNATILAGLRLPPQVEELCSIAVKELLKVERYQAPREKLVCMLNAYRIAEGVPLEDVFQSNRKKPPAPSEGCSVLVQLLAALIVKARLPNAYSNIEFTSSFRYPSRLGDDERRCLQDLSAALALVMGKPLEDHGAADAGGKALPPWLVDAGVTFHFQGREAGDLLVGEVEELLDEYQKMVHALKRITASPDNGK